jgi:hypothetical protein
MTRTDRPRTSPAGAWLAGVLLGVLTGLTTISFVLGLLGLPILAVSVALILWKGPRLLAGAGFFTGWGLLCTVAITQSTIACLTFERGPGRWCEPAENVGPWIVTGVVAFVVGLGMSALALRRRARQSGG